MQNNYCLSHLVLNKQREVWGENRILDIIDSKSEAASNVTVLNLENQEFPGQILPLVKIGNTFTVPFFRK